MKKTLLFVLTVFAIAGASAQNSVWNRISEAQVASEKLPRDSRPTVFSLYALDMNALKAQLQSAPSRDSGVESNTIIAFPNPNGTMQKFRIYEASVMHPDLAA
jgi:hypothetical protein